MMSRTFTTRENALLIILFLLLLGAVYYYLVFMPTAETILTARSELSEIEDLLIVEDAKSKRLADMLSALETLDENHDENTITPQFDNFQNLLDELNVSLRSADSYKLNFLTPIISGGIAERELQLVFYSPNYRAARRIIGELYSGPYRCEIISFRLTPTESNAVNISYSQVMVTMSIVYYEIAK